MRTAEFTSTDPLIGDARTETPNHRHIWVGQLPLWVNRDVLTVGRSLPVYPQLRTYLPIYETS